MSKERSIDKMFLFSVALLILAGIFTFSSASLGLLARDGARLGSVIFTQLFFGLTLGLVACYFSSKINYRIWRKYAFYIFILAVIFNALLLIPSVGFTHGGATRWIIIFGVSIQPSEILKFAFVIYFAAWLSGIKDKVKEFKYGMLPLIAIFSIVGFLLLKQPDTDTFLIIVIAGLSMYLAEGGKWKHLLFFGIATIILASVLAFTRPYIMDRINTFLDPSKDPQGAGYQIQQSLIAIGSGGVFGKGFGQSVQKFNYLPEPIGDSIFAVAGEEFGLIGTLTLLGLFIFFAFRGLMLANRVLDSFGRLLIVGIVILIVTQSLFNIAGALGLAPLGGIPLVFISHGGTALFFTLFAIGIVFNVSKYRT